MAVAGPVAGTGLPPYLSLTRAHGLNLQGRRVAPLISQGTAIDFRARPVSSPLSPRDHLVSTSAHDHQQSSRTAGGY